MVEEVERAEGEAAEERLGVVGGEEDGGGVESEDLHRAIGLRPRVGDGVGKLVEEPAGQREGHQVDQVGGEHQRGDEGQLRRGKVKEDGPLEAEADVADQQWEHRKEGERLLLPVAIFVGNLQEVLRVPAGERLRPPENGSVEGGALVDGVARQEIISKGVRRLVVGQEVGRHGEQGDAQAGEEAEADHLKVHRRLLVPIYRVEEAEDDVVQLELLECGWILW